MGRGLSELRRYRGWSQQEVAAAAGMTQPKVANAEAGDNITLKTLARLITALRGRLQLNIEPEELNRPRLPAWWDMGSTAEHHSEVRRLYMCQHMTTGGPAVTALLQTDANLLKRGVVTRFGTANAKWSDVSELLAQVGAEHDKGALTWGDDDA